MLNVLHCGVWCMVYGVYVSFKDPHMFWVVINHSQTFSNIYTYHFNAVNVDNMKIAR